MKNGIRIKKYGKESTVYSYKRINPNTVLYKGDFYRPDVVGGRTGLIMGKPTPRTTTKKYFFTREASPTQLKMYGVKKR